MVRLDRTICRSTGSFAARPIKPARDARRANLVGNRSRLVTSRPVSGPKIGANEVMAFEQQSMTSETAIAHHPVHMPVSS
jgi:hypothetical protein